eukprot:scaffold6270_cov162-Amphora_coffeaeformis.AAC.1
MKSLDLASVSVLTFFLGLPFTQAHRATPFGESATTTTATTHPYYQYYPQHDTTTTVSTTTSKALPVNLGTTLVAIRYDKGVVVGADSRTSVGGFVSNRYAHKLARVTPHCTILRSGSAADTQAVARECRLYFRQQSLRYGTATATTTTTTTVTQIAHYMRQAVMQMPHGQVSLLVAGYDHGVEAPRIYSVALSGALLEEGNFAVAGSGSVYVLGYLDNYIPHKHDETSPLTESEAVKLCQRAIDLAASRDGSSGGVVRVCVIDKDGTRPIEAEPAFLKKKAVVGHWIDWQAGRQAGTQYDRSRHDARE